MRRRVVFGLLGVFLWTGCGSSSGQKGEAKLADGALPWLSLPAMAPALSVPARAALKLHEHGDGVQIYTCTLATSGPGMAGGSSSYAWVLKAPDARLFAENGALAGLHGAGPVWTWNSDGSSVTGAKVTQVDSPESGAIPWLLLRASSTRGAGELGDVTYVQRLLTHGGKAPTSGCDATTVNSELRVHYTAEYYFYTGGA